MLLYIWKLFMFMIVVMVSYECGRVHGFDDVARWIKRKIREKVRKHK